MAERVNKLEATSQFRMNPIVALVMLLILLITTGSLRKARRLMGIISRGFMEAGVESLKVVGREGLNDTIHIGVKGELNRKGKRPRKVKVELEPETISKPPLSSPKGLGEDLTVKPTLKVRGEARNLDDTLISYIRVRGCQISISECSRDLGIPPSEVKKTLVRLHELGRIRLQWGLKHSVEPSQTPTTN